MENFWNKRYKNKEYVYGVTPNVFFKESLDLLHTAGNILLPAEGEGRNAVYAASKGWQVEAFDNSEEGREKALKLAAEQKVNFHYSICNFQEADYPYNHFDVIALIYAHVPETFQKEYYNKLIPFLKKGGYIIFEGFNKEHIANQIANPNAGGPKDIEMLFSKDNISEIFSACKTIHLANHSIVLSEGLAHSGKASVVRYIGKLE